MTKNLSLLAKAIACSRPLLIFRPTTQYNNNGDVLITRIELEQLRHYGQLCIDSAQAPALFKTNIKLQEIDIELKLNVFNSLALCIARCVSRKPTYLILSPGHVFSNNTRSYLKTISGLILLFALRFFNVKICRFGASVGPFTKLDALVERLKSSIMHYYSVRDSLSLEITQRLKIASVRFFPDWALLEYQGRPPSSPPQSIALLSFRESTLPQDCKATYQKALLPILDILLAKLGQENIKPIFAFHVDADRLFNLSLTDRYKNYGAEFEETLLDHALIHLYLSKAKYVASNRLHVLLQGLMAGSSPIVIIDLLKHTKISGLLRDNGLQCLILDIHGPQPKSDLDRVWQTAEHIHEVASQIHAKASNTARAELEWAFSQTQISHQITT